MKRLSLLAMIIALAAGGEYLLRVAPVGTGYKAKTLCSAVFVSGRNPNDVLSEDLAIGSLSILRLFSARVDVSQKEVFSHFLGGFRAWGVWRPGLGCALARSRREADSLKAQSAPEFSARANEFERLPVNAELEALLDSYPLDHGKTRALIILKGGRIAAERYAPGFSADMPLLGWSMTKSVVNALWGIRSWESGIPIEKGSLFPEWTDGRAAISIKDLLFMKSGLHFAEVYSRGPSDVTRMLFKEGAAGAFAASMPLESAVGARWSYSSGTTNMLSVLLSRTFPSMAEYRDFPRRALFEPLGMKSAVMETDCAGYFVGSSFMYATARDWARFGQFFLDDGVVLGRRILPENWVQSSLKDSGGEYGAHIWTKLPSELGGPEDLSWAEAYYFLGHEGQVVTVIPSRKVVVVRLGLTVSPARWDHASLLRKILSLNL